MLGLHRGKNLEFGFNRPVLDTVQNAEALCKRAAVLELDGYMDTDVIA